MSNPNQPTGCGCPPATCPSPVTTAIPGPTGANGQNAFTTTSASFTMPAIGATVTIAVVSSLFAVVAQIIFIQGAGYYQVTAIGNDVSLTVKNLGYVGNAVAGTVIASPAQVSPGGLVGPIGTLNSVSPTTTKGDLIADNGAGGGAASDVRLAAGSNKQVLHADSSQAVGLRWGAIDLTGANSALSGALPIANGGTGASTQSGALNNLMPAAPVNGNTIYFNGTNWVATFRGTIQKIVKLFAASSGTSVATGRAFGSIAPGTGTGALAFTQAVTPLSAASVLRVEANIIVTTTTGGYIALFNGTTLIAVRATSLVGAQTLTLLHEFAPGATTPLTLNVYVGNNGNPDTVYIGGTAANSANFYGSASNVGALTVEEIV